MFTLSFCSGGVDLIFKGKQLNIIPTDLVIEIIDRFTGDSVMNYTRVIPCQINKEFRVTSRILTKLGVFVVPVVLITHANF